MRLPVLAIVALFGTACVRSTAATDSTFVAVTAELRRIGSNEALDSAAREAARTQVLQGRGLTPLEYERMAREIADDPERAVRLWEAVETRLRTTGEEDEAPEPETRPGRTRRQ